MFDIRDRPELFGQVGRGNTLGDPANYYGNYGSLKSPTQSDIAAFNAALQPSSASQQAERAGKSVEIQKDNQASNAEKGEAGLVENKENAAKLDKERQKQDAIGALVARIQGLQMQLQQIDSQISMAMNAPPSASGENTGPSLSKLSSKRTGLVAQIQQLQQQLQSLLSS